MADSKQVKAALAALADGETREAAMGQTGPTGDADGSGNGEYRAIIHRATSATEDIEAAAEFIEAVGLDRLEAAVEAAEHEVSGLAAEGRGALATFERFRVAAEGPVDG